MNKNKSLLLLCLITSGLTFNTLPVSAEEPGTTPETSEPENSESDELNPMFPPSKISNPILSEVELGVGYISDDSWRFGRYNGMKDEGAYVNGNIDITEFWESVYFLNVKGRNLGLDSRYLEIEGGKQGAYEVFLEYDRIPSYKSNTVKSPFYGIGSNNLTLPAGFNIDNDLNANQKEFNLKTRRERFVAGLELIPAQRWQFEVDFGHENKTGLDITGAAIAGSANQLIRNTTTALIPEPIDYDTNTVNATLSYIGDKGQMDLTYHMSLFENDHDNLSWDNPFFNTTPGYTTGNMSLAPDNEFHQLAISGSYNLPYKSRISGLFASGRMTQDDDFQPYTSNTALLTPLPQSSLDGEVWVTNAHVKLVSRPIHKLRLNAEYRYNERDNDTTVNTYDTIVLDGFAGSTVTNRPYSYENQRINLDANYRFNSTFSVHAGYKYNEMDRDYTDAEREQTEEDTFFAKWKIKPHSDVNLALFTEISSRDGDTYKPLANENPDARKYFLADRDRTQYGVSVDYIASESLLLSARAEFNEDDYDDTIIGLTEEYRPTYSLDFSYTPNDKITIYGYYTYENIESDQAGYDYGGTATSNWEADYNDTFHTYGLGFKWQAQDRLELGGDFIYSDSTGEIDMKDVFNPGTENQYPDNETSRTSVRLWANYTYNDNLSYKLSFWYEEYDAENWAYDDVPAYTSNSGILYIEGDDPDYDVNVISLSATYRF